MSFVSMVWELYSFFRFLPLPPSLRDENMLTPILHFFINAEIIFPKDLSIPQVCKRATA